MLRDNPETRLNYSLPRRVMFACGLQRTAATTLPPELRDAEGGMVAPVPSRVLNQHKQGLLGRQVRDTVAHPDEVCQRMWMFRLLGLLGGLSLVTDLGTGAPLEESLKRSVVATRLARETQCEPAEVSEVLYTSLLQHLGCTAYTHEGAQLWGADIAYVRLAFLTDFSDPKDMWRTWLSGLAEATGRSKARVLATALTTGRTGEHEGPKATCEVARAASRWLGLPASVQTNLMHAFAMWNGKGHPEVAGNSIPSATRVMQVASAAVLFGLHDGPDAAVLQLRRRAGTYLDPGLVDLFVSHHQRFIGDLYDLDGYEAALACEPDPVRLVDEAEVESVARAFGSLADLKSPWYQGHSVAVGDLAAAAVLGLGLNEHVGVVRIAGYLHDVGRVGVSSRIWDKSGPLSASERDQAQLHSYYSERIVARIPALTEVAEIVGQHHERCDGSGYHRGLAAGRLTMPSRVLAAADAYRDLVEDRPHRDALPPAEAAARLRDEARCGRLDADAVSAVLAAAGHAARIRRTRPAGLTDRQVKVLGLVAAGMSNQEIAKHLGIARRTAEHHVQDVYLKIGVSTRAGAALFAMEHGLLSKAG